MPKNIFKKKFLGYSPADVAEYIEKINSQAANELEYAERKSLKLREEKEKLSNMLEDTNSKLQTVQLLEAEISELKSKNQELILQTEELKELLTASNNKYTELEAEFKALSLRYDSATEENNSYEKTCKDAGNILLIAQSKSEEIIENSNKNYEVIIANARISAEEILQKAEQEAKLYLSKVKAEADSYASKVKVESDVRVEQAREKVEFLMKRQKQLISALQNHKSEITKFYDETVSGLSGSSKQG